MSKNTRSFQSVCKQFERYFHFYATNNQLPPSCFKSEAGLSVFCKILFYIYICGMRCLFNKTFIFGVWSKRIWCFNHLATCKSALPCNSFDKRDFVTFRSRRLRHPQHPPHHHQHKPSFSTPRNSHLPPWTPSHSPLGRLVADWLLEGVGVLTPNPGSGQCSIGAKDRLAQTNALYTEERTERTSNW